MYKMLKDSIIRCQYAGVREVIYMIYTQFFLLLYQLGFR